MESTSKLVTSRHISVEKHALNQKIDDLPDLQVIQPSRATAWSQVHLVRKPTNGWRFTVDFRNLNKVISNEGWQIPNMNKIIERIGSIRRARFTIADLTSRFFQMPFGEPCRQYAAFSTQAWRPGGVVSFYYTYGPPQLTFHEQPWFQESVAVKIGHKTLWRHHRTRRGTHNQSYLITFSYYSTSWHHES